MSPLNLRTPVGPFFSLRRRRSEGDRPCTPTACCQRREECVLRSLKRTTLPLPKITSMSQVATPPFPLPSSVRPMVIKFCVFHPLHFPSTRDFPLRDVDLSPTGDGLGKPVACFARRENERKRWRTVENAGRKGGREGREAERALRVAVFMNLLGQHEFSLL